MQYQYTLPNSGLKKSSAHMSICGDLQKVTFNEENNSFLHSWKAKIFYNNMINKYSL